MQRLVFISLALTVILSSCKGKKNDTSHISKQVDSFRNLSIDTSITNSFSYQLEQEELARKRILCSRLGLYDLEKGTNNFELRLWKIPSMWDPSILYILKANDTCWTLFHYQYYTLGSYYKNHRPYESPIIDSVKMESVMPQRTNWPAYIQNLQLDSLWDLQTESGIKGKSFGVIDGHHYILELSDKGKYKYLYYTVPEDYQKKEINHKKFIDFKKRLIDPIIYNRMVNAS